MVAERSSGLLTVEEYLALEERSEVRHEYVDGRVCAMAGDTVDHDRIANAVRGIIDAHLGDGPCAVGGPDVRVQITPTIHRYPDAFVVCDASLDGGEREVTTPLLIVEVLSDTTEAYDRGDKWGTYQMLASLQEYALVASRRRLVECFRRGERGLWTYQRFDPDEQATLESIDLTVPVAAFYRRTRVS